jgi:PAS domain S-box-containing protein
MDEPASQCSDSSEEGSSEPDVQLANAALLDAVSDGIYQLDDEGYFVAVNDAMTDLTGYDRDALVGSHAADLLDAEDVVRAEEAIRDRLLDGSEDSTRLTLPVFTAAGEVLPCEICVSAVVDDGEFRGTVGVVRTVEDEDAAEIRNASERRRAFDALAEASPDGIVLLDDESTVRYASPGVERILGYDPAELVGHSTMKIIPERLREAHVEAVQRYLDTGEKHIDWTYVELPGQHVDGHEVPLAISFGEFELGGDHYFVGTFRDVSKRKAAERELERQNERLDQFASMLAHELRNPLQTAQIYLDFVASDEEQDDGERDDEERDDAKADQKENGDGDGASRDEANVEQIEEALQRIDEIIEVLLVLARGRGEVVDREPVALADVATQAWTNASSESAQLAVETDRLLNVNPTHLQHLLENLFRNSVEHGDEDVTVRIGDLEDGFYVEDDGPGITEDQRQTVVEAGYTTDSEGIGLGLTFVTQLADAYDWEYAIVESDAGGVRFEFTGVESI